MPRTRKPVGGELDLLSTEPPAASPVAPPAMAGGEPPDFISVTVQLDIGTYLALATDARQDGVSVERFIARHLRKCAEAGGYPI
jgi:hypothetical protein